MNIGKMGKSPKVEIGQQGLAENVAICGNYRYAAATLVQWCKEKNYPIFSVPLASIDLTLCPWDIYNVGSFIYHMDRVMKTDLKYPIILSDNGAICDGWHRVAKAILEGKTEISAIRIQEMPAPDGVQSED